MGMVTEMTPGMMRLSSSNWSMVMDSRLKAARE